MRNGIKGNIHLMMVINILEIGDDNGILQKKENMYLKDGGLYEGDFLKVIIEREICI